MSFWFKEKQKVTLFFKPKCIVVDLIIAQKSLRLVAVLFICFGKPLISEYSCLRGASGPTELTGIRIPQSVV